MLEYPWNIHNTLKQTHFETHSKIFRYLKSKFQGTLKYIIRNDFQNDFFLERTFHLSEMFFFFADRSLLLVKNTTSSCHCVGGERTTVMVQEIDIHADEEKVGHFGGRVCGKDMMIGS